MELPVNVAKPGTVHMRIDLSRRYRGMPKHFLDGAYVGTVRKKVRGETMPENVRRNDRRVKPRGDSTLLQDFEHPHAGELFPETRQKKMPL